jgi:predicted transcriptional regulator
MPVVSEERPLWRQGYDVVEAAVAPRIRAAVGSESFAVAVGLASRARLTAQRRLERTTRRLYHLANLPAGSDVTRILAEIAQLRRQVVELTRQLDGSKDGSKQIRPTSRARR